MTAAGTPLATKDRRGMQTWSKHCFLGAQVLCAAGASDGVPAERDSAADRLLSRLHGSRREAVGSGQASAHRQARRRRRPERRLLGRLQVDQES